MHRRYITINSYSVEDLQKVEANIICTWTGKKLAYLPYDYVTYMYTSIETKYFLPLVKNVRFDEEIKDVKVLVLKSLEKWIKGSSKYQW